MYLVRSPLVRARRRVPSLRWNRSTTLREWKSGNMNYCKEGKIEISTSRRKFLHPLVVILGIISCGLLGIGNGTALAGVHGLRINYEKRHAYRECTTGMNEKGESVHDICNILRDGSNPDNAHLWVGQVKVIWYYIDNGGNSYVAPRSYDLPESQIGDYVTFIDPI